MLQPVLRLRQTADHDPALLFCEEACEKLPAVKARAAAKPDCAGVSFAESV